MNFEIAKKLEKVPANVKGNSLRSITGDNSSCRMIIVADNYGDIKNLVESFKMLTNSGISFRMRGKSIDVSITEEGATTKLMEFAKGLSFTSEDAADVIEFFNKCMPIEGCEFIDIDLNQDRLKLQMKSEEFDQEKIMALIDPYKMGIIK